MIQAVTGIVMLVVMLLFLLPSVIWTWREHLVRASLIAGGGGFAMAIACWAFGGPLIVVPPILAATLVMTIGLSRTCELTHTVRVVRAQREESWGLVTLGWRQGSMQIYFVQRAGDAKCHVALHAVEVHLPASDQTLVRDHLRIGALIAEGEGELGEVIAGARPKLAELVRIELGTWAPWTVQ